jgi:tetratricopeptide (TPR) repeat protein
MVLYDSLTGRRWSMLTPVKEADWTGVPQNLARVLKRALAMKPADRWADAGAFRAALNRAQEGSAARHATLLSKALAATLALVIVVGGAWGLRDLWMPRSPPVSQMRIAVLPFSVGGSSSFDYLSMGMVDLLSTALDGAGELRSADPRAVLSLVEQEGLGVPDPEEAQGIASGLGAGLYVLGSIVEVRGNLKLDASLFDPNAGLDAVAHASAEGGAESLFDLVDEVAAQLLVGQSLGSGATRIAEVTTSSLPALKAYLEGERAFRAGYFAPAAEAFQLATELDTTFALAWYRLGVAADWMVRSDLVELSAQQAYRLSSRLSDHDRDLFEAFHAYRLGDPRESERLYRAILSTHPDDVEAWIQLGELLFHFAPYYGRSIGEARAPFERVLFFEPNEVHALTHLIRISALEGDADELVELVERYLALHPDDDRALEVRALREFVIGDEQGQQQVMSEMRFAELDQLMVMSWSVPVFTLNLDGAVGVVGMLTDPAYPSDVRALGHTIRASLLLAQGKWRDARVELNIASSLDAVSALEYRALLSATPFLGTTDAELEAIRSELRGWTSDEWRQSAARMTWSSVHDEAHAHLRLYLLGLLSARLDDGGAALQYAQELGQLDGPDEVTELAGDLAQSIRAQVAIAEGEPEDAIHELEQATVQSWYQNMAASLFYAQAFERYTRAELLAAAGREEEALNWYSSFTASSSRELIYLAPSHLKRAEIYERLGDDALAAHHYETFIALWRDCDPELRPLVDYAAERLTLLASREHR